MSTRYEFKQCLLTYAQCGDLSSEKVGLHLSDLGGECIIAREEHADGGLHLHAMVVWEKTFRTRRHDWADVEGFHPNIEVIRRTPWKTYDYVIKDGNVEWGGLERPVEPQGKKTKEDKDAQWREIHAMETAEEVWAYVNEYFPKESISLRLQLNQFIRDKFPPTMEEYKQPDNIEFDISAYDRLQEWVDVYLKGDLQGGKFKFYCLLDLIGCAGPKGSSTRRCARLKGGCLARPGTPPSGTRGGPPLLAVFKLYCLL